MTGYAILCGYLTLGLVAARVFYLSGYYRGWEVASQRSNRVEGWACTRRGRHVIRRDR
jgi:hypothetical protein